MTIAQGKGGGTAAPGGLSQGKAGATASRPVSGGGKPVVAPPAGPAGASPAGGDLARLLLGNQGYGGGVKLPDVTQPTRPVPGSIMPPQPGERPVVPQKPQPVQWPAGAPEITKLFFKTPAEMQQFYASGNGRFGHDMQGNDGLMPAVMAANYRAAPVRPAPPATRSRAALLAAQINEQARKRNRS